ncbi:MAG: hypothetical protein RMA76_12445 [Deltaproteobacteria bacterium]
MNDAELQALAEDLASDDLETRLATLAALRSAPEADRRVLTLLEARLDDRAIGLVSMPPRIGEVRTAVVDALDATRRALDLPATHRIEDVHPALSATEVESLAAANGVELPADPVEAYKALRDAGVLPTRERVI